MAETRESDSLKIDKLETVEGCDIWKFQVKVFLSANSLFKVVDGSRVKPVIGSYDGEQAFNKALDDWTKDDYKAQKIMVQSIGKQPTLHIMNCGTAREMWTKLESVYEQKSKTSIHMLQQKFYSCTKDSDDDIAVYISKLKGMAQQLKDLGEQIPNSMLITKILMTLPENLLHFQSAWESTTAEEQTIENLTNRLMMEESRAQLLQQSSSTFDAFVSRNSRRFSTSKSQQQQSKSKSGKCFVCNENGHWKRNCPTKKNASGQSGSKTNNNSSDKKNSFESVNNQKPFNTFKRADALIGDAVALSTIGERNDDWFFDTGATYHLSYNFEWFENFQYFEKPETVRIGSGTLLPVLGFGNITILAFNGVEWITRSMKNVCYVPDLRVNLFSGITAMDKGLTLEANSKECKLIRSGETIVCGIRENRMFKLQIKVSSSGGSGQCCVAINQRLSLRIWHERLSHQNIDYVKRFLKNMNIGYDGATEFFCEGCVMGKQHRLPFPKSANKAKMVGELVHTDVCGKMHETSFGDDFSHFRSVYFMKEKSEVAKLIEKYIGQVKANTTGSVLVV